MNKKKLYRQRGSTLFLKVVIIALGLLVVILCAVVLPVILHEWNTEFPKLTHWRYPVIFVLTATAISFFIALYQSMKLLGNIDKHQPFSTPSLVALKNIATCALVIGGLYTVLLPLVFLIAEEEDAPGLILMFSAIFIGLPIVLAVFASVIQRLLQNVITIKSENDLTV